MKKQGAQSLNFLAEGTLPRSQRLEVETESHVGRGLEQQQDIKLKILRHELLMY
jgi:hypothetical protein